MTTPYTSIPGSNHRPSPSARLIGPSNRAQTIRLSIYVRRNPKNALKAKALVDSIRFTPPMARTYPARPEFEAMFGSDPSEIAAVEAWAKSQHLTVKRSKPRARRVEVEGSVGAVSSAFHVGINDYEHAKHGRYRSHVDPIQVPAALQGVVEGVFGIDNRRVAHSRRERLPLRWSVDNLDKKALSNEWPGTFFPPQVAQLYGYPQDFDGTGQNVAIFTFNGSDGTGGATLGGYSGPALKTYFTSVLGGTMPKITDVVVMGPGNDPGPDTQASENDGDATGEVMLDLCVLGSCAPGANVFMYFTEFTAHGWADAITDAITDENDCSVISISYGNPENDPDSLWSASAIATVSQAMEASIARGVTVLVASGDDGSGDGDASAAHTDYPASDPSVTGVGGTKLVAADAATIKSEVVWNETTIQEGAGGGGVSAIFSKPSYQNDANVPLSVNPPHNIGRGVPDVAAVADPSTGVVVMHVSGKHLEPVGGTSAATPIWAALVARINQGLGKPCGFLNQALYTLGAQPKPPFRDIVSGNNGAYQAAQGWDACTGWGSPNGQNLLAAIKALTAIKP